MTQQSDATEMKPSQLYADARARLDELEKTGGMFILATNSGLHMHGATPMLAILTQKQINEVNKLCQRDVRGLNFNEVVQLEYNRLQKLADEGKL